MAAVRRAARAALRHPADPADLTAAVAADTTVTLSSSDPNVLPLPATLVVPTGQSAATVSVLHPASGPVDVTVTVNGVTSTQSLTIVP